MATVRITFRGLVLHYDRGTDGKLGVLVKDSGHAPLMLIRKTEHVKDDGWTPTTSNADFYIYDLKDANITIDNLTSGTVTESAKFKANVPSLEKMIKKGETDVLHADVKAGKAHADVAAYLTYTAGDIDVLECFEAEAVFDPAIDGDPRCLPRLLRFTGTTTAGTAITIVGGAGKKVVVEDGAEIQISNSSGGGADHHKLYKQLLDKKKDIRDLIRTVRVCGDCAATSSLFFELNRTTYRILLETFPALRKHFEELGDITGIYIVPRPRSISVECGNTQWP